MAWASPNQPNVFLFYIDDSCQMSSMKMYLCVGAINASGDLWEFRFAWWSLEGAVSIDRSGGGGAVHERQDQTLHKPKDF